MADAPVDETEIEVEITVRVRSRAKGSVYSVARGKVGMPLGASAHQYVARAGRLTLTGRHQLADVVASFARVQLGKLP